MNYRTYLEKLENRLEVAVMSLESKYEEYKNMFIELLNRFREIYDIELIESGEYPTF